MNHVTIANTPLGPGLLAQASRILAEDLSSTAPAREALQLLVPSLASWCVLDCTAESGGALGLTVVAEDPSLEPSLRRIAMGGRGIAPPVGQALLGAIELWQGSLALQELDTWDRHVGETFWSSMPPQALTVISLRARGRVVGTLSLGAPSPLDHAARDTLTDLASRMALAVDNASLVRRLREAVRAREDLLAMVSHDLRSPLGAIMMAAGYLNKRGRPARRGPSEVHTILRNARRMERLLRDLLDYSQLEAGTLRVQVSPQRLSPLVERELAEWRTRASPRLLAFHLQESAHQATVLCDQDRIKQVLDNLINNAISATPQQGRIDVRVSADPSSVLIAVQDTGAGIPPEDLDLVFKRYRGRHRSGAGLGLYITRGLVEAHGGHITVRSRPGEGSCFMVTLPRLDNREPQHTTRGPIFLVDDDELFRRELQGVLENAGYRVATAESGHRALDYLRQHEPPSMILMDLVMPQMNGWELQAALREQPDWAQIPTVVFSCLDRERAAASLTGVAAYLEKPLRVHQLMNLVRRFAGPGSGRSA